MSRCLVSAIVEAKAKLALDRACGSLKIDFFLPFRRRRPARLAHKKTCDDAQSVMLREANKIIINFLVEFAESIEC
jgi:hypothetical protein